ncbi:phage portal protein [Methylopila sp. 73B]|uniref:phage portal protein n=1 Tax=Methylopila sp. 73B TaxID=1120792 RepID=UPI00037EE88A|nr:phage portal protein [Methylopila sp. 73B]
MGMLSRVAGFFAGRSVEGAYRDGPYNLPITGGILPAGSPWNWWQTGADPVSYGNTSTMVEACVSAYSQTVAMCPGDHWRTNERGGRERVVNSALARILRKPNDYQSISDFMLNAVRSLYVDGNTYALALRNDRFEISELHLMNPRECSAQVSVTGEVFYRLGGNPIIDRRVDGSLIVPARDVLHIRLHTPRDPLKGESPISAAAMDLAAGNAMLQQQIAFYLNQARPSSVLVSDQVLTKEQVATLRELWNEQSKGLNAGGTPILSGGLKPFNLGSNAKDAQLVEMLKLSEQHVALVFRTPLQILGIGDTPFASTEALMTSWVSQGLGFALNHVEEAFGLLFGLKGVPADYLEFDTSALLRSNFKERMEGWAVATKAGLAINEFRNAEGYASVAHGNEPRVQQQDVPLSAASAIPSAPPAPPAPAASEPDPDSSESVANDNERARQLFRASHVRHVTI